MKKLFRLTQKHTQNARVNSRRKVYAELLVNAQSVSRGVLIDLAGLVLMHVVWAQCTTIIARQQKYDEANAKRPA